MAVLARGVDDHARALSHRWAIPVGMLGKLRRCDAGVREEAGHRRQCAMGVADRIAADGDRVPLPRECLDARRGQFDDATAGGGLHTVGRCGRRRGLGWTFGSRRLQIAQSVVAVEARTTGVGHEIPRP